MWGSGLKNQNSGGQNFLLLFDHYGFKSCQGQNLVDQTVAVSNSTIFGEHTKCMNFKIIIRNAFLVFLLSKTFFVSLWIWIGDYAENKSNNNYNKHMHPKVMRMLPAKTIV